MIINHNLMAMTAYRAYSNHAYKLSGIIEKLSTGMRINRAADDPSGLMISERMRSQIRGLRQASLNCLDGISVLQTAEGALDEVHAMLQRMNELAVKAANGTWNNNDREAMQMEINQLAEEIDSITSGGGTQFNKINLFDGTMVGKKLQTGANAGQTMDIGIEKIDTGTMGLLGKQTIEVKMEDGTTKRVEVRGINVMTPKDAGNSIAKVANAIKHVSLRRSEMGAKQNRLEYKINNLNNQAENLQAAESRIRDADMAKLISEFYKESFLMQAAQLMLAQANQVAYNVLYLLRM